MTPEEKVVYMKAYGERRYGDPEKRAVILARSNAWYMNNKARKAEQDRERRKRIGDDLRAFDKERASLDHRRALKREWSRKRKMTVMQATPPWVSKEDKKLMRAIYTLAVIYTKNSPIKVHVDHIEPLHGEDVCGLHVPANLQLLPASVNISKHNRRPHFQIEGV